jgi:hypothetical protein
MYRYELHRIRKIPKEIADQYKERIAVFTNEEVVDIAKNLGFEISPDEIVEAEAGNVHATYITNDFVIKITKEKDKGYLPNKVVSDTFPDDPVVHVLTHDVFEKTPYEVLVMKKSPGVTLQEDILELPKKEIEKLFSQVLDVVNKCFEIKSGSFGFVTNPKQRFNSYKELQQSRFNGYIQKIREQKLAGEDDIKHIEAYFNQQVDILDGDEAVFLHRDLHMGNMLHVGDKLTAIIDWDSAIYGPRYATLQSILGFINQPSQFVEGTPRYKDFKDVDFKYLMPLLREKLPEVFADEKLLQKLNLVGIVEGLMWVSQNWSEDWNKEMISNLVNKETPEDLSNLKDSYYGQSF